MKTVTLWGIWCDAEHPNHPNRWLPDAETVHESALVMGLFAVADKAQASAEHGEGENDETPHEHVAPIARLTMLPPPKTKKGKA